jgi:hypothetical protein
VVPTRDLIRLGREMGTHHDLRCMMGWREDANSTPAYSYLRTNTKYAVLTVPSQNSHSVRMIHRQFVADTKCPASNLPANLSNYLIQTSSETY